MKTTTVQELKALLDSGSAIDLVDVRTPVEYETVHVPGARLHQIDGLDCAAVLASRKAPDKPLYLLCHSGGRATKAAALFAAAGCQDCVVVEGGTQAWVDAGLPVNKGGSKVLPLAQQLQLVIGAMVLTGVILSYLLGHNWVLLSGFAGAGLTMAGLTGICPMRSLLARMPWNQTSSCSNKSGGSCCSI